MANVAIKDSRALRFGSCDFQVQDPSDDSWISLGVMNDVSFTEEWTVNRITFDNSDDVHERLGDHHATVSGDMAEIDLELLALLQGGLSEYSETGAGADLVKVLESGGKRQINARAIKLVNTNEEEKDFTIEVFKAKTQSGIAIDFPARDAEEVATTTIEMRGDVDSTKDAGKQLFKITDAQTHDGT